MMTRAWAFGLWAAAAASAVFWGLKLFVTPVPAPPFAAVAATAPSPRGDLSRLFGVDAAPLAAPEAAPPPESDRFALIGVVAPRAGAGAGEGVALIAVDGKSPRAYRVGAVIDGDTVLQGVSARGASLGPRGGAAVVALDLPPPAPAATGVPQPAAGAVFTPPPLPMPAARPPSARAGVPPQLQPPRPQPQMPQIPQLPQMPQPVDPAAARSDALQTD
jgi:general secretion pathway protein C